MECVADALFLRPNDLRTLCTRGINHKNTVCSGRSSLRGIETPSVLPLDLDCRNAQLLGTSQTFDTQPSREILYMHRQREAATATPTSTQGRHTGHSGSSSYSSYTPRSQFPDSAPGCQETGGVTGSGFTASPAPDLGSGGGGVDNLGALSWTRGDIRQEEPDVMR